MENCVLCFGSFPSTNEQQRISCGNPNCIQEMCVDCIQHLIQHSYTNQILPTCPVQTCREIYLDSDLNSKEDVPREFIDKYRKACFDFFLKSNGDSIQKKILEQEIIDKIRAEKLQFLEASFPPAIALVARIAFKHKLHKINEHKKELVHLKVNSNNKKCFYQSCCGFLEEEEENIWKCLSCESRYCKLCEKDLESILYRTDKEKDHICNESDVESLNIVNGMIRCPGCDIAVFKDIGCDFITCANCSTRFHYKTGEATNHGSVNAKIVLAPEQRFLSSLYRNELSPVGMETLLLIESLRPPQISKNSILRPIHKFLKTPEKFKNNLNLKNNTTRELVNALDKYTRNKYISKKYIQTVSKIEKRLLFVSGEKLLSPIEDFLQTCLQELR